MCPEFVIAQRLLAVSATCDDEACSDESSRDEIASTAIIPADHLLLQAVSSRHLKVCSVLWVPFVIVSRFEDVLT